jgi:hypothetical protein
MQPTARVPRGALRLMPAVGPTGSKTIEKPIVLAVVSDPEPDDFVSLAKPYGAIAERNSNRVDWFDIVDLFELQTWMGRILPK